MAAPKGNQFWKLTGHDFTKGVPKKFAEPKELWEKALEYFQWCDDHPWIVTDAAKGGDRFGEHVQTPTARPYTLSGLCLYLGINQVTLNDYGTLESHKAFHTVTHAIKEICYTQKLEGAAVGVFNANIIARDLGLTDKQEITETRFKVKRRDAGH
jgi:hypothetical protein